MNDIERFKSILRFEKPDYVPIFAFPGAPGMSWGTVHEPIRQRLVEQGMPEWVGKYKCEKEGVYSYGQYLKNSAYESWMRYWGTTGPIWVAAYPFDAPVGLKYEKHYEDEFEIIEYETGAVTRQVVDNENIYIMPEFREFHVRDRKSWEYYRDRMTPGPIWSDEKIEKEYKKYSNRIRPLSIYLGSTYGNYRDLVGPYNAAVLMYDDPGLVHEIIEWENYNRKTYIYPLVRKLKPEILAMYEDCCYNNGMLLSPKQLKEFCTPIYAEMNIIAKENGVDMSVVDCDGNIRELVQPLEECGVNAMFPFEQKAGNDILKMRKEHPDFIIMGGLEKEVVNEGNDCLIRDEIMSKVPLMLEKGGYFPNGDHSIQPLVTFENLCKFFTLLHEVTGNPEGEFPRIKV